LDSSFTGEKKLTFLTLGDDDDSTKKERKKSENQFEIKITANHILILQAAFQF
jgi:hypothetical protein